MDEICFNINVVSFLISHKFFLNKNFINNPVLRTLPINIDIDYGIKFHLHFSKPHYELQWESCNIKEVNTEEKFELLKNKIIETEEWILMKII
jgi:hypothetical protein